MSDEDIRALERRWRASGDPADGEAWVQAKLRTTGAPMLLLMRLAISNTRAMLVLAQAAWPVGPRLQAAWNRDVTPDDMVAFLDGFPGGLFVDNPLRVPDVPLVPLGEIRPREAPPASIMEAMTRTALEQLRMTIGAPGARAVPPTPPRPSRSPGGLSVDSDDPWDREAAERAERDDIL